MEADIAQIKILLWIILGLMAFFVTSNILCHIFKCGQPKEEKYGDLWQRGQIDELLEKTRSRLSEHPHDISALYFGAKALAASGMHESAMGYIRRLMLIEPTLREECEMQLAALEKDANGT
jgi:hypothetical protein